MKTTINFFNKKESDLEIKKGITFIFGSNGMGKSTIADELSKKSDKDNFFIVYNDKFISENIYYIDKNKIESDKLSSKRSDFFINKKLKILNDIINTLSNKKNTLSPYNWFYNLNEWAIKHDDSSFLKECINKEFSEKVYNSIEKENLKIITEKIRALIIDENRYSNLNEFIVFFEKNLDDLISNYNWNQKISVNEENTFKNKKESFLNDYLISSVNKNFVQEFNRFIKESTLSINEKIEQYEKELAKGIDFEETNKKLINFFTEYSDLLNSEEKKLNDKNLEEINDWIFHGKDIHSKNKIKDLCLFCNSKENLKNSLEENIKDYLSSNLNKTIKNITLEINNFFEKLFKIIEKLCLIEGFENIFLDEFDIFKNLTKKFDKKILDLINQLNIIDNKSKAKENIDFKISIFQLENIIPSNKDISGIILKKFINENIEEFKKNAIRKQALDSLANKDIEHIKELEKQELNQIEKSINETIKELDEKQAEPLGFKVKATNGKRNESKYQSKIKLVSKEENDVIKEISKGQRNMLSFIFFIAQLSALKKIENRNIIVVIDDPVDSSDFYSYFLLKDIIIKNIGKNDLDLVILTHNFEFSSIYLQKNEEEQKKYVNMFVMNKKFHIKKIDENIFKISDDLLLVKLIDNFKEINLDYKADKLILFLVITTILLKCIEKSMIKEYQYSAKKFMDSKNMYSEMKNELNSKEWAEMFEVFYECRNLNISIFKEYNSLKIEKLTKTVTQLIKKANNLKITKIDEKIDYKEILQIKIENGEKLFCKEFEVLTEFIILNSWDAARLMQFSKIVEGDKDIEHETSNYLRHTSNSVSSPLVALNFEKALEKINKKINFENN
ncbi:AAA family ATPase [Mesoplasma coleopterae]|uniref:AAA family ATPase n=1 Tax=Mesoplasma coleopterae TaxID=324078 RepID=UPI000D036A69|nr:AAA family ATPase [Mesoplasma coleopterae]AVN63131.1 hypothetical protein CG000_02375 [Mesoplasma coleopterae]